jgi:hypothetical protein
MNAESLEGAEAAAVHPSPMVAAAYGSGYRGRGRGRGWVRGSPHSGREHIKNLMAAKTWVRKKDDGESQKPAEEAAS